MNEELKIIIKAVTAEAKKQMQDVKKELNNIKKSGDETGKGLKETMQAVAKGAAVAVAAITAVTTAMVALGKKSAEAQKQIGRLISNFQAMGSTAAQAKNTYTGLYRFLGESDTATEAANLLSKITTNEKELVEWTQILQGVYASFPSSLPVEALAESANETIRVGKVTGNLADALNWMGVSEDAFNEKLATTNSYQEREILLRSTLNGLYMTASRVYERNNQALLANNEAQARLDVTLAQAHRYLLPLLTAVTNLANALLTYLRPALEVVSAVLIVFIQYIIAAIKWVGSFFGIFSDSGSVTNASQTIADSVGSIGSSIQNATGGVGGLDDALNGAVNTAKELKKQTMGFDELNVMQSQSSASGGTGGTGGSYVAPDMGGLGSISMPDIGKLSDAVGLTDFSKTIADVKEKLEATLTLVGLVAAGFGLWKLAEFVELLDNFNAGLLLDEDIARLDAMKASMKKFAGLAVTAAGAVMILKGYTDAWANGVDWGNMALLIGGVTVAIIGLQIAFGNLSAVFYVCNTAITITMANIALFVAGIAMLVLGVKDFIQNGPTLQNTILIIGGAIAVAVALATAGLSVLVSAIVGAVAAIGAFVAAIILEEPAIMTVEEAQNNLTEAINRTIEAENSYISALDNAEAAQQKLKEAEEAAGISGEELRKQVENGTLTYADMTDAQKACYKAYLDNEQKQKDLKASTEEFEKAKKAETLASFENQLALAKESGNYDDYKKSVIDAYNSGKLSADEARMMIEKSMSEMSDASQKAFMEDIPGDITNGLDPHKYESTGTKIKKWFGNLWEGIKNVFSSVGNWFKDIFSKAWQKVKDVFSAGGKIFDGITEGIANFFKTTVNGIIGGINKVIAVPFNAINGILSKIKNISIAGIKPFNWIGTFSVPQIPKLAKGGIVTGDTLAHIGEEGYKEAVLPLERNTEWMDILAKKINANGSDRPIHVHVDVDGTELGWTVIRSINEITRQTGGLQLAL